VAVPGRPRGCGIRPCGSNHPSLWAALSTVLATEQAHQRLLHEAAHCSNNSRGMQPCVRKAWTGTLACQGVARLSQQLLHSCQGCSGGRAGLPQVYCREGWWVLQGRRGQLEVLCGRPNLLQGSLEGDDGLLPVPAPRSCLQLQWLVDFYSAF